MKRLIKFFILFICLQKNSFSQSCIDSSTRFLLQSGSSRISIKDNEVLADSSVIIAGNMWEGIPADNYFFISKLDKNNNILFSKKLIGFTGSAKKIIECNNGDLLVVAATFTTSSHTLWLIRFSSTGNLLWQKQIDIPVSFAAGVGYTIIYENSNGDIYLGTTGTKETNPAESIISGYYYIYKLGASGNSIWKTTLVQIENTLNNINALTEKNGELAFITQQYAPYSCNATDAKSVSLFRLNANNGLFVDSKTYCLNFYGVSCLASWSSNRHTASFMADGKIIISGQVYFCDDHRLFTLETDQHFGLQNFYSYTYITPYRISIGSTFINRFGQVSLYSRGFDGSNFLYATLKPDGTIIRQRKLQLPANASNSIGTAAFAFRKPDQFLIFSNFTQSTDEVLQIMEFKGDNNGTADCTGKDTTFITAAPHTAVSTILVLDTIRTESFSTVNSNFPLSDFSFQRTEVCSSISICDSLKIDGIDSVCLDNPIQDFLATRNPSCNKVPEWKIDPSAVFYMQSLNDTAIRIKFKRAWEGYLYAYSNSCSNLLDSFYIKVFSSSSTVNIGRDTSFCSPVVLDAGNDFIAYKWQDNSTSRFYTVNAPGLYYVSATAYCGNVYTDSINFYPKKTTLSLGVDTCIAQYPYTINAGQDFKNYQWQDGSVSPQFSIHTSGLYYVTVRNFCNEIYTDSIRIYKKMQPFSLGRDSLLCPGNTILLQAPPGYHHYQWQDGSNGNSFPANTAGKYYVAVTDFCGNRFTDTVSLTQSDKKITLGPDVSICKKEQIQLSANGSFSSYSWTPVYNISSTVSKSVLVNPEQTTTYYVVGETPGGCTATDTVIVFVKNCPQTFFMPSAFTPNKDGKNDLLRPIIIAPMEKYEFSIYNRWGQRIFHTTDKSKGWDGKIDGIDQDPNSFVWICTYKFYNLPPVFEKGTFMLIR